MNEDAFWDSIAVLDGVVTPSSVAMFERTLKSLPAPELESFGQHLHAAITVLDAEALYGQPIRDQDDPDGAAALPLMGDALLDFLFCVVAAGRVTYLEVRDDPSSAANRTWSFEDAELLPQVIHNVFQDAELLWEDEDLLPLEMPEGPLPWTNFSCTPAWGGELPEPYHDTFYAVDEALGASSEWQDWWAPTGLEQLQILAIFGVDKPRVNIARGKTYARATFEFTDDRKTGRTPDQLRGAAVNDLHEILERTAKKLGLGTCPDLPDWAQEFRLRTR